MKIGERNRPHCWGNSAAFLCEDRKAFLLNMNHSGYKNVTAPTRWTQALRAKLGDI